VYIGGEREVAMGTLFGREVYIRLSENGTSFLSTIEYGRVYRKTTEFPLQSEPMPEVVEQDSLALLRKKVSDWPSGER
jgi:hypothetical protein